MKQIKFKLSPDGINTAIREMQIARAAMNFKPQTFRMRVAEKLKELADRQLASAWHNDLVNGGKQSVYIPTFIEDDIANNRTIVVADSGVAVFVEFGAGIHHNGGNAMVFSSTHPYGADLSLTIGSYPNGGPSQGVNDVWDSPVGLTYGTKAQMPMWYAMHMIEPYIEEIAKEVFKDDRY